LRRALVALALDGSRKFGSMEEQVFLLARAFRQRGSLCVPLFLGPANSPPPTEFAEAGLPAESLPLERFRLGTLWQLLALIRKYRIQIVHWNFFHPLKNPYLWWVSALRPSVAHYYTDHNSRTAPPTAGRGRALKRLLLWRYRWAIGVSQFVVDSMAQQGVWSNLTCRLHFINTERFRPDPEEGQATRQRLGDSEKRFVVLTTGNLIPEKGIDVLLRALALLPESVVAWVVGEGPESGRLRELAAKLGVAGRARFLGLQRHVQPFMQAADCFACPSVWAEAAGLVNLEAQSCGLPVIASRIGGIPEYVEDGVTGLLFQPGDAAGLATQLRRLMDHPAQRRQMAEAARERAQERFSPEHCIERYLDLYRG
jgi:glycosyltransferase involved in cell wall biosynthesis